MLLFMGAAHVYMFYSVALFRLFGIEPQFLREQCDSKIFFVIAFV